MTGTDFFRKSLAEVETLKSLFSITQILVSGQCPSDQAPEWGVLNQTLFRAKLPPMGKINYCALKRNTTTPQAPLRIIGCGIVEGVSNEMIDALVGDSGCHDSSPDWQQSGADVLVLRTPKGHSITQRPIEIAAEVPSTPTEPLVASPSMTTDHSASVSPFDLSLSPSIPPSASHHHLSPTPSTVASDLLTQSSTQSLEKSASPSSKATASLMGRKSPQYFVWRSGNNLYGVAVNQTTGLPIKQSMKLLSNVAGGYASSAMYFEPVGGYLYMWDRTLKVARFNFANLSLGNVRTINLITPSGEVLSSVSGRSPIVSAKHRKICSGVVTLSCGDMDDPYNPTNFTNYSITEYLVAPGGVSFDSDYDQVLVGHSKVQPMNLNNISSVDWSKGKYFELSRTGSYMRSVYMNFPNETIYWGLVNTSSRPYPSQILMSAFNPFNVSQKTIQPHVFMDSKDGYPLPSDSTTLTTTFTFISSDLLQPYEENTLYDCSCLFPTPQCNGCHWSVNTTQGWKSCGILGANGYECKTDLPICKWKSNNSPCGSGCWPSGLIQYGEPSAYGQAAYCP